MEFKLLGKTLEVSDGRRNYMKVVRDYRDISSKAQKDFFKQYDEYLSAFFYSYHDAEKLMDHFGGTTMDRIVKRYVSDTRKYLASYEIYTLSDDEIWSEITKENSGFSELQFSYMLFLKEASERTIEINPEDPEEYMAKLIKEKFKSGYFDKILHTEIMRLCDFVINYLDDNEIVDIEFVYKEDSEKAITIYKNLQDNNIPNDKKADFAFNMIELDPREKWYYEYIFHYLPQARYEIVAIARYLYLDLTIHIDGYLLDRFKIGSFECEEDALKMMDELKLELTNFGGHKSEVSESLQKDLKKILTDFDVKARTYEGVLYNTREECANAQKEDLELKNLYGDANKLDKKECYDFLAQIKQTTCNGKIKYKHITILNERIAACDQEYLQSLVANIDNCSEDECNKVKEQINEYDSSEALKEEYLQRVEMRLYIIWDVEDFERFSEIYVNTQVDNVSQIEENCKLIKETGRTGCKEKFVKALSALTNENIEIAAKYAMAKDGFFSSIVNMGKKDIYVTLSLDGKVVHPAITEKIAELKNEKPKGLFGGLKKSLFGGFGSSKKAEEPAQVTAKAKFCSECGEKLAEGARFCPGCGKKVE